MNLLSILRKTVLPVFLSVVTATAFASSAQPQSKIGIFNLSALRSVSLEPEVLKKEEHNGIVTEYVRFTSVPGVRVLTILTYKRGLVGRPGVLFAQRFEAHPRPMDAAQGFVGIEVAPPKGNDDPKKLDSSVGGPKYTTQATNRQLFNPDPNKSYIYHHVVALIRALDYLETRKEVNLAKTVVVGQDESAWEVSLLHALDDRPLAYMVWQGAGLYSDEQGNSGDQASPMTRAEYEMYAPAAYAQYGSKPIYLANPLNSVISPFDALFEFANKLKSYKILAYAPNRQEVQSEHKEFDGSSPWLTHFLFPASGHIPSIKNGSISLVGGKLVYTCQANGQTGAFLLVSYGKPGNWQGRTWHRVPMKAAGSSISGIVPIYDPKVPFYVMAQLKTKGFGERGNPPMYVEPSKLGISQAYSTYPHLIFCGDPMYETFVASSGSPGNEPKFGLPGKKGFPSAILPVYWTAYVRLLNIEPIFWSGAKEIRVLAKGDGTASAEPVYAYLASQSSNKLDTEQQNFATFTLIPTGEIFPAEWKEYVIPLKGLGSLAQFDSLFFQTRLKPIQIASVSWH